MIGSGQRLVGEHLDAVVDGLGPSSPGRVIVLGGPPGIGLTHLLGAAADRARARGLRVLHAVAAETDAAVPLGSLGRLLPGVVPAAAGPPDPFTVVEAASDALGAAGRPATVVVLDDAHLVDELSAWVLHRVLRSPGTRPVLWLFSGRFDGEGRRAGEVLDDLPQEAVESMVVPPLDENEVRELCGRLLGARPGPRLMRLARGAGGIPYLLVNLIGSLLRTGHVERSGDLADLPHDDVAVELGDTIDRHLGELSPGTRDMLDAASVLPQPFAPDSLAALLGETATALLDGVDEALRADVLRDDGDLLRFRHELIRSTVHDRLEPDRRRALHERAAAAAEAVGRPVAEVVEHLLQSGRRPDADALDLIATVVRDLGPVAPGTAGDLVVRALRMVDRDHPARTALLADAVRLTAQAGHVCEARELGEAALAGCATGADRIGLLLSLAVAHQLAGYSQEVVGLTDRALAECADDPARVSTDDLADVLAIRAHALLDLPAPEAAAEAAVDAGDAAARAGRVASRVCALAVLGAATRAEGRLADAERIGAEAVELTRTVGGEVRHRVPRLWQIGSLIALDRLAEAAAVLDVGQAEAERLRSSWSAPAWEYCRACLHFAAGRLAEARVAAEAGVRRADQLPTGSHLVGLHELLAEIALLTSDREAAHRHLDRADALHGLGLARGPGVPGWVRGLVLRADDRPGPAFAVLEPLCHDAAAMVGVTVRDPAAPAVLVGSALRGGGRTRGGEAATVVATTVARLAERNPGIASVTGAAAHVGGVLDGDPERILRAADHYRLAGRPLAAALAVGDAVDLDPDAVGPRAAAAARDIAEQAGATALVTRFTVPPPTAPAVAEAEDGWGDLTDSEIRVARLVARGMTNREVAAALHLSPHTVDSHLRRCFGKTGVSSRVELTRVFLARGAATA